MKIFINRQKVKARAVWSNAASVGGLLLLLASVLLPLVFPQRLTLAYVLMIAGLGVAMVGIYFANRWVRKPRPEDSLAKALKSFDDSYRLYLYPALPCDHLLLTPAGVVVLQVFNLDGRFSYKQGRWKEAMTIGRALRYIVEEHIGDPVSLAGHLQKDLDLRFKKEFGSDTVIPIKTVVAFTHPAAQLDVKEPPIPICKVEKLKKQISFSTPRLTTELYEKTARFLESLTIK